MELTEIYLQILFLKIGLVRCFHAAFFWETVTNPPSARYHAWFSVTLCGSVSLQAPGSRLPASPLPCSGIEFLWGMPLPLYSCFDHVIKKTFSEAFPYYSTHECLRMGTVLSCSFVRRRRNGNTWSSTSLPLVARFVFMYSCSLVLFFYHTSHLNPTWATGSPFFLVPITCSVCLCW